MTNESTVTNEGKISTTRMALGGIILAIGFLSPLLIPVVTASEWSAGVKTVASGLLAFGIPELFILLAVAVMGKSGYEYIKAKIGSLLKPFAPPDQVSPTRYRIGLVLFCAPLLFGGLLPYAAHFFPSLETLPLWPYIASDLVFIASFFILGGDFWDKVRALFDPGAMVVTGSSKPRTKA